MRKHLSLSPRQYAHVLGCGLDAVYSDIREGGINSVTIGKRKIRIPAAAVEAKLHLEPGDLDPILDAMKG